MSDDLELIAYLIKTNQSFCQYITSWKTVYLFSEHINNQIKWNELFDYLIKMHQLCCHYIPSWKTGNSFNKYIKDQIKWNDLIDEDYMYLASSKLSKEIQIQILSTVNISNKTSKQLCLLSIKLTSSVPIIKLTLTEDILHTNITGNGIVYKCESFTEWPIIENNTKCFCTKQEFINRFNEFTCNIFDLMDDSFPWNNIAFAGGAISKMLRSTYDIKYMIVSDVDMFIIADDIDASMKIAETVINWFYNKFRDSIYFTSSYRFIDIYIDNIRRHYQLVIKNYKSINALFYTFDQSHVRCAYFKKEINCFPEFVYAIQTSTTFGFNDNNLYRIVKSLIDGFNYTSNNNQLIENLIYVKRNDNTWNNIISKKYCVYYPINIFNTSQERNINEVLLKKITKKNIHRYVKPLMPKANEAHYVHELNVDNMTIKSSYVYYLDEKLNVIIPNLTIVYYATEMLTEDNESMNLLNSLIYDLLLRPMHKKIVLDTYPKTDTFDAIVQIKIGSSIKYIIHEII